MDNIFKSIEDYPEEITVSTFWSNGKGMSYRRSALPINHPENEYNWFKRTYPNLDPYMYNIKNPREEEFSDKSREQLIDEILSLRDTLNHY